MLEFNKYFAKIAFNLHFQPQGVIVTAMIMLFLSTSAMAQQKVKSDTLAMNPIAINDTVSKKYEQQKKDSLSGGRKISKDAIDKDIKFNAENRKIIDLKNRKVILLNKATVTYGDIDLTADSIVLDMESNSVYATGIPDSTGKLVGKPVFKDGSQQMESKELTYNFKSKKAFVKDIRTEQEGGYLNSSTAKLNNDGTIFVDNSKYSTCDAEEPHFYIKLKKAKFYPGEKIVSGPANLVVEDIPLPIIIPYGFFPIQSKRASGFIMPKIGQENARGYYISEGGFYFALNDYLDLKFTGSIYTNGTWLGSAATTYKVRYRYSGNFNFQYANNISGYKGLDDYYKKSNYSIKWSHKQDDRANPSSRFSASVDMSSSGFDKNNSYNINDLNTTTRQSSVSYSKTWIGTPFNFSTSFNQSQNVQTKNVALNLPKATFTVSRFYPFKPKNPVKSRWYHDIQMQYTANVDNKVSTYDSLLFTNKVWSKMTNGFKHEIPVSIPIKAFSNFSISPQLSYSGVAYTQKILKHWDPDHINPTTRTVLPSVVDDTIRGFFYGQAIVPSVSASYSPTAYGKFEFINPKKVQAIRHVIKPTIGFSYRPAFPGLSSDMYKTVQSDTKGSQMTYSIYDRNIFGTPSVPKRSGSVSFALVNILEAKILSANDTTGKPRKVKLIDNLSANTNYNIFKDTCRWDPVSLHFNTTILQNINISANSTLNLYGINNKGTQMRDLAYSMGQGIARMTNLTFSVDFDLGKLLQGKSTSKTEPAKNSQDTNKGDSQNKEEMIFDEFGYVNFTMPWSMRVRYSFNYSKPAFKSTITNSFSFNGDVKVTPKIALTYTSGYDFESKKLANTSINIVRDLHCWQLSVSWIPVGPYKSWYFTICPKAGILKDLKYERRRDYHETY